MQDKLNAQSLPHIVKQLKEACATGDTYKIEWKKFRQTRSLSLNAFQHAIYGEVSKYLIANGRTEWTPKFVKANLKNKFLGWMQEEFVDVVTGEITVKETLVPTSSLDQGESVHYTTQILEWAESINCHIRQPVKSEYREIMERMNQ